MRELLRHAIPYRYRRRFVHSRVGGWVHAEKWMP